MDVHPSHREVGQVDVDDHQVAGADIDGGLEDLDYEQEIEDAKRDDTL
jgi:hypothetical protein